MNHMGLDLKSSDLTRPIGFASDMLNAQYRKNGTPEKRVGFQPYAASDGGLGIFNYSRINPSTNLEDPKCVSVDNNLNVLLETKIVVAYTGIDPTAILEMFYDTATSQYRLQLTEGTSAVLDQALGLGFDEASTYTATSLAAAINGITNFTATLTGSGTTPAAFFRIVREHDLVSGGSFSLIAKYWSTGNQTATTPFNTGYTARNNSDFEIASSVQLNNVLYISNGYDYIHKYDGQTFYRAGLPSVASLTHAIGGGTGITGNNYHHRARYIQYDAVGNIIEGNILRTTAVVTGLANQDITTTVANVVAGSGFNTNCAIVNGPQGPVSTITVDDGSGGAHTMKVGDTAYFYDAVSASYVEREVTAVAATTITVAGATVTVADNAVISNNLRIGIYRNETSATEPTVFYTVVELPNNSFTATQVYLDATPDASLGAELIEPVTDRTAPPKGKYISAFKNQMVVAGNTENPNTVYWSDIESCEYFPNTGTNQADVLGISGKVISGIAPNNEVFAIFQNPGLHVLSGDIASGNIRIDMVSTDIGCAAHASIQEIKGELFFLSDSGPRRMVGGQLPQPLGRAIGDGQDKSSRIDVIFDQNGLQSEEIYIKKRAVGFHDRKSEKYVLYLPCESTSGSDRFPNSNARLFVYDYSRDAWLKWDTINMHGGACIFNDEVMWTERRYSTYLSAVANITYRQHSLNDGFDYQDHNAAISWSYKPQWEALDEPSIYKNFVALKMFSIETVQNSALMLRVGIEINYIPDTEVGDFEFDFSGAGYGVSPYGTSAYGDSVEPTQLRKMGIKARSLRTVFTNDNDQENVALTGWEFEIGTEYNTVMKS
jgi:hypothetical protein